MKSLVATAAAILATTGTLTLSVPAEAAAPKCLKKTVCLYASSNMTNLRKAFEWSGPVNVRGVRSAYNRGEGDPNGKNSVKISFKFVTGGATRTGSICLPQYRGKSIGRTVTVTYIQWKTHC
jgi:hypothetical protein